LLVELMQVFIVRHGETKENKSGIIQGHLPGHLSNLGKKQAAKLGRELKKYEPFDRIISSDLIRAKESTNILNNELDNKMIFYDQRLRERNYGSLEGQPVFKLKRMIVSSATKIKELDIPNGEDYSGFEKRITDCFRETLASFPNKRIILMTHAGVIQIILEILNLAFNAPVGNCQGFHLTIGDNRLINCNSI